MADLCVATARTTTEANARAGVVQAEVVDATLKAFTRAAAEPASLPHYQRAFRFASNGASRCFPLAEGRRLAYPFFCLAYLW